MEKRDIINPASSEAPANNPKVETRIEAMLEGILSRLGAVVAPAVSYEKGLHVKPFTVIQGGKPQAALLSYNENPRSPLLVGLPVDYAEDVTFPEGIAQELGRLFPRAEMKREDGRVLFRPVTVEDLQNVVDRGS